MKEHELRVVEEKKELELKCDKLTKFVFEVDSAFSRLPYAERLLLRQQLDVMERYLEILEERIARFS